jgi:predicted methyltransferase
MRRISLLLTAILLLMVTAGGSPVANITDSWQGTRVSDPNHHQPAGTGRYPYRTKSDYVLRELDLRPGDVVLDIGAGDGFWAERMAEVVGKEGTVYASEVEQNKVDRMKEKFGDLTQVKPYLCPTDGTGLSENSCELAFLSKTYHHLDEDGRVDYLRHLRKVVRPTGRLCVIERYADIAGQSGSHDMLLSQLVKQAEQAGWIAVRYELMTGTYHYIAIFVQKDLFPPERSPRRREDR